MAPSSKASNERTRLARGSSVQPTLLTSCGAEHGTSTKSLPSSSNSAVVDPAPRDLATTNSKMCGQQSVETAMWAIDSASKIVHWDAVLRGTREMSAATLDLVTASARRVDDAFNSSVSHLWGHDKQDLAVVREGTNEIEEDEDVVHHVDDGQVVVAPHPPQVPRSESWATQHSAYSVAMSTAPRIQVISPGFHQASADFRYPHELTPVPTPHGSPTMRLAPGGGTWMVPGIAVPVGARSGVPDFWRSISTNSANSAGEVNMLCSVQAASNLPRSLSWRSTTDSLRPLPPSTLPSPSACNFSSFQRSGTMQAAEDWAKSLSSAKALGGRSAAPPPRVLPGLRGQRGGLDSGIFLRTPFLRCNQTWSPPVVVNRLRAHDRSTRS